MLYIADFETNVGSIRAIWDGHSEVHLFTGESDSPTLLPPPDSSTHTAAVRSTARKLAHYVLPHLWENIRGLEVKRITTTEATSSALDFDAFLDSEDDLESSEHPSASSVEELDEVIELER